MRCGCVSIIARAAGGRAVDNRLERVVAHPTTLRPSPLTETQVLNRNGKAYASPIQGNISRCTFWKTSYATSSSTVLTSSSRSSSMHSAGRCARARRVASYVDVADTPCTVAYFEGVIHIYLRGLAYSLPGVESHLNCWEPTHCTSIAATTVHSFRIRAAGRFALGGDQGDRACSCKSRADSYHS